MLLFALLSLHAIGAEPRQILILDSFGPTDSPFRTVSFSFQNEIIRTASAPIEFHDISMESARFGTEQREQALVNYVVALFPQKKADLVVAMGADATRFWNARRDAIMPGVPLLIVGTEERILPGVRLAPRDFAIPTRLNLPGLISNILQVLPETTNIVTILGDTPLEQYWVQQMKQDVHPFADTAQFSWLNKSPLPEIRKRVASLPPRHAILFPFIIADVSGTPQDQDEVLRVLHDEASAPIFGLFQRQLGRGIMGGPVFDPDELSRSSARIALRLLNGETPPAAPPISIGTAPPSYDWRELQRWNVDPSRLPPDSTILFKQESLWSTYKWQIIGALVLIAAQAGAISGLLFQRARYRRVEQQLKENEAEFRLLIENATDMITVLDRRGFIRFRSPSSERILGYNSDELHGRNVFELVHPEDLGIAREEMRRALEQPAVPGKMEIRIKHKDGTWRNVAAVGKSVPGLDIHGYVIINSRDITEQKRLETQMRQAQKLEAIGQLSGGVAHDFNNLLTIIKGNAMLMREQPGLPAEAVEFLDEIDATVDRAARLTRQLLTFSRRQPAQPQDLNLNDIATSMMTMLRRLVGDHISIKVDLATEQMVVHADPGMMEQIILNLTVNARDAMPEGGQIAVATSIAVLDEAAAAKVTLGTPGTYVRLDVTDTGLGIAPEALPHIFEPFFTTKESTHGTGLGLATVYGIVEQHRGCIGLASQVGAGTRFSIYLPKLDRKVDRITPPEPAAIAGGTETILLVEDSDPLRDLARNALSKAGYRVFSAPSGARARTLWREHREQIDLLITDMVMPDGINGLTLAAELAGEKNHLKVLYMSGYSPEIAGSCVTVRPGVNFLSKPFGPDDLLRIVRSLLDQQTR